MRGLIVAATLAFFSFAPTVSASTIIATQRGILTFGIDGLGLFGPAGADLTGDRYKVVATFNTQKGFYLNSGAEDELYGGSSYSLPSAVAIALTINRITFHIGGDFFSQAYNDFGSTDYKTVQQDAQDVSAGYNDFVNILANKYGSPYSNTVLRAPHRGNVCRVSWYCGGNFAVVFENDIAGETDGIFEASRYGFRTVPDRIGSVPEPSTWAMMLLGFAALPLLAIVARANRTALQVENPRLDH